MPLDERQLLGMLAPEYHAYMEWLRAQNWPPLDALPVPDARARMRRAQRGEVSRCAASVERHALEDFPVQIVKPAGAEEPSPIIVYCHGGGWVLGDFGTHGRMVRELAAQSRAAAVFVEYARAPETRFPVALEQCYRALTWVDEQGGCWP